MSYSSPTAAACDSLACCDPAIVAHYTAAAAASYTAGCDCCDQATVALYTVAAAAAQYTADCDSLGLM